MFADVEPDLFFSGGNAQTGDLVGKVVRVLLGVAPAHAEQDGDAAVREKLDVLLDDRDLRAGIKFKDADLLGTPVVNIGIQEVSALGAAHLAGLREGIFNQLEPLSGGNEIRYSPGPCPDQEGMRQRYDGWLRAVRQLA